MGFWAGLKLVERCYCPEGVLTIQRMHCSLTAMAIGSTNSTKKMARFGAVGAPGALPARSAARPTSTGPTPALVPAGVPGKPLPPARRRPAALISRAFLL